MLKLVAFNTKQDLDPKKTDYVDIFPTDLAVISLKKSQITKGAFQLRKNTIKVQDDIFGRDGRDIDFIDSDLYRVDKYSNENFDYSAKKYKLL